ncbi:MAG: hypothetical protein RR342_01225 [Bacilli bacterium]
MTKVYCADLRCKYRRSDGICLLKEINLSQNSIVTVWEGRKEFNTCMNMEESEEYKKLASTFRELMEGKK